MRAFSPSSFTMILLALFCFSCKKQTETIDDYDYQTERLTEIFPLKVGRTITYQTDSTVFTNFGRSEEIHSYIERDTIDAVFQDALGRTSYRVTRYLQDPDRTNPAFTSGTYYITPTATTIEVTENNLRYVKLTTPVKQDATWKGNLYLPAKPYRDFYSFNNDGNMQNWNFVYSSLGEELELNGRVIPEVTTITEVDQSTNMPFTGTTYASVSYAVNKYAKGIGLIYQELIMWDYQLSGQGGGYKTGFGVKRTMIDHN